ncbi:hypothetical protein GF312_16755 [Candidatus Poribacteria bacterium]|nr:hypothetical protein [Candidatus Poribacteria bacterium]
MKVNISLRISFILFLIFLLVNTSIAQEMVTDGLVSFWTMDQSDTTGNTARDMWGSNHGSIEGSPEVVPGKIDEALLFNGEDDFIEIDHSESLNLVDAITIEFWFVLKGDSLENDYPRVVSKGQSTTDNGAYSVWVGDVTLGNDIGFRSVTLAPNDIRSQALPNYNDDAWHHVVITYDGSQGRLYLDGVMHVDIPVSGDIAETDEPLHIGDGNNERHFNGIIDEVRIYNKALTEDEVMQNFNVQSNLLAVDAEGKLSTTWARIKN